MKKILILTEHYPSESYVYNYMFIHARVLEYKKLGADVKVLYLSKKCEFYIYEGVEVYKGDFIRYKKLMLDFCPDVIFTHSPKRMIIDNIENIKRVLSVNNYTWIHGVEALSVYRRVFNIASIKEFFNIFTIGFFREIRRVFRFRRYVKFCNKHNDGFIFVSDWMKQISESDNFIKIPNSQIIPNFIDFNGFNKVRKGGTKNILIVRSFESKKYANDISVMILNELNKLRNDFTITIFGKGRFFHSCINALHIEKSRLFVTERMLSREELKYCLKDSKYSFFMSPTRQDAQGVTMCEAMASGLVVVTNNSTAIPEFVSENYAVITDNNKISAKLISEMMDDESLFLEKSRSASKYIKENLSSDILISKELDLIDKHDS